MALVALVALVAPRGVVRVALVAQEALVAPCEVVHVSPSRARVFRSRPLVLLVAMEALVAPKIHPNHSRLYIHVHFVRTSPHPQFPTTFVESGQRTCNYPI